MQLVLSGVVSTAVAADFAANFGGFANSSFNQAASTFDTAGNAYIVGTFSDASLTIVTVPITRIGTFDTVVAKIDASGAVVWPEPHLYK